MNKKTTTKITKEDKILLKKKDIVEKSNKFLNKYYNFNKFCLLKNDKSLYSLILKEYQSIENFLIENKDFINTGRRSWTYNNLCLGYSEKIIPDDSLCLINKNTELVKHISDPDIYKNISLKKTFFKCDLIKFLNKFLKTKLIEETENEITYYYSKEYNKYFFILDESYKYSAFHKSYNKYANYIKNMNKIMKRYKNKVVFDYENYINLENIYNFLMLGGINIYKKFNFLCIDPPTRTNLGYSIFNYENGKLKIISSGVKEICRSHYRGKALKDIYEFVDNLCKTNNINLIVSESSFGYGVAEIRTLLSENVGIFNLICEYNNIPFITVSPLQFKANVLGDKKANKEITIEWVKDNLSIKDITEHEADAIVIGISFLMDRELINEF